MTEIKNCPSCGVKPMLDDPDFIYPATKDKKVWSANCCENWGGCGLSVLADNKEGALTAWQRRPNNPEPSIPIGERKIQQFIDKGGEVVRSAIVIRMQDEQEVIVDGFGRCVWVGGQK